MDNFQEQMEEIEQLKAKQALHRKRLEVCPLQEGMNLAVAYN